MLVTLNLVYILKFIEGTRSTYLFHLLALLAKLKRYTSCDKKNKISVTGKFRNKYKSWYRVKSGNFGHQVNSDSDLV